MKGIFKSHDDTVLLDLGGGEYAIHFTNFKVTATKTQKLKLQIFLEGNNTGKPNATLNLTVNIA